MARIDNAITFQSSQDFVRSLKAASDPPVAGGPAKIEIAQQAWANTNFYVPSKAEVIADWILTKMLKNKSKELSSNPIFDSRYWQLLSTISNSQATLLNSSTTRSTKSWLTTLLHRIPFGSIIPLFLTSFKNVPEEQQNTLAVSVSSCLSTIWPIAVQRMSPELLQECFGACLSTILMNSSQGAISNIGRIISTSYRNSLNNSSNKKKLYLSFLQSHLKNWLSILPPASTLLDPSLETSLLEAGVDTLFNLDILRQNHGSRTESPLVDRLRSISKDDRALILMHLPILLGYYIQAIKKHRGALFMQSSQLYATNSLDELHANGIQFFIALLTVVDDRSLDSEGWSARMLLLKTVDKENIFDNKQEDAQVTFNLLLELILQALGEGWNEEQLECTGLAVQCLSTIATIDYDLVLPFVPRILPLLLQIPVPSKLHFDFLEILLSYHTKTRTMGAFVQDLLAAISMPRSCPGGSLGVYQLCSSSPIMHTSHLERLARALQAFLTESQTLPTMQIVFGSLKDTWERFYAGAHQKEDDGGAKKKRRTSSAALDTSVDSDDLAVKYTLIARLSSVVLSSLPMTSLSGPTREEVRRATEEFRKDFVHHAVSKTVKLLWKRRDTDMWSAEVTLAASLRLLYALDVSRNLSLSPSHDPKLVGKMLELVSDEDLLPELTLELFRALLFNLSQGNDFSPEGIIDQLLEYIEKNFAPSDVVWSGNAYHLTKGDIGRAEAALAAMHMVVERWLPEIDRLSSPDQLQRLLKVILSIKLPVGQCTKVMQPEQLLLEILHSAEFFEFPNIRTVCLELINKKTSRLDIDSSSGKLPKTSIILEKVSIYQQLLLLPMEYFSWQLLSDLINRALTADVALSRASGEKKGIAEALIVLRVFLKRAYFYCGSVGQDSNKDTAEFLVSVLKESPTVDASIKTEFNTASLDLVEVYLSKLLKSSKKNGPDSVLQVLNIFTPDIFVDSQETLSNSFTTLVNLLTKDFPKNGLPEGIVSALQKLNKDISACLLPHLTSITEMDLSQKDVDKYFDLISGWYTLLCLNKWLETTSDSAVPMIGQKLTSKLISSRASGIISDCNEWDDIYVVTFAILLQELEVRPLSEHSIQLDLIVAVYITFSSNLSLSRGEEMDAHLRKTCKKLAVDDYTQMLSLVSESLGDLKHIPQGQILHLVHLAAMLLHEHPSHSLVHVQKFATSCINTFTEHPTFVNGPVELRLEVLEMMAQHCSNQQAALRSQDMAGICLLLSKFLTPSKAHDSHTESRIFHKIIAILSALIRLRRDLVSHSLPHLGLLLRQLILCMRGCRANLGARQTAIVTDTQPHWLNAGAVGQALGAEEARALARLLESLTAKTIVRFVAAPAEGQTPKAESLAKPFAKHAAYVLQAYVEAVGEPLAVLPLDVRRDLLPGVFALCGMVSEHSRDALMVSALDAGGRATLKTLWREYDKQRYIGRG